MGYLRFCFVLWVELWLVSGCFVGCGLFYLVVWLLVCFGLDIRDVWLFAWVWCV